MAVSWWRRRSTCRTSTSTDQNPSPPGEDLTVTVPIVTVDAAEVPVSGTPRRSSSRPGTSRSESSSLLFVLSTTRRSWFSGTRARPRTHMESSGSRSTTR